MDVEPEVVTVIGFDDDQERAVLRGASLGR